MNRASRRPLRRIIAAGIALVLMVGWFVVRLVDIQVVRAAELNAASEDVRSRVATIYGERGEIVDANGTVLAESVMRYDIALSPKQAMIGPVVREQPDPADPAVVERVRVRGHRDHEDTEHEDDEPRQGARAEDDVGDHDRDHQRRGGHRVDPEREAHAQQHGDECEDPGPGVLDRPDPAHAPAPPTTDDLTGGHGRQAV